MNKLRGYSEHMQRCAYIYLRRVTGDPRHKTLQGTELVDAAITSFGSEAEFKKWADDYTASGCGVKG